MSWACCHPSVEWEREGREERETERERERDRERERERYIYIYIYIYAVGSITWPSFFWAYKKRFFLEIFWCTVFRGWCKISVLEKKLVKKGVSEKKCAPFFWGVLALLPCCCMMALDALEGCAKNPIKISFFEHLLARCRRNRKMKKNKNPKKSNTPKMGGLENGQEVVPPFFPQKWGFSKSSKTPIFIAFPEKWVVAIFFWKRLCYKEDTFRRAKKW